MAARINPRIQDQIREKIKAVQLINFVQTFALTGLDTGGQEVNPARIQAAKILLDKSIASLSNIDHSGEIVHSYVAELPGVAESSGEWSERVKAKLPHLNS